MLNSVILIGRLTKDPELRHTASGKDVGKLRLAVDRPGKDNGTDFIDVTTWNGTAQAVCSHMHKGSLIAVDGYLRTREWEAEDGSKRYGFEINASTVKFLEPKSKTGESVPSGAETTAPAPADDDIPF